LIVVALPIAASTYGVTAELHHRKWARYQAELQKEVDAFRLNEELQRALAAQLCGAGTNNATAPGLRVQVQPYRVLLRGDEHQKFVLEVAVRVRLLDPAGSSATWEHNYVDAGDIPKSGVGACETPIPSINSPHPLKDFQGDAGAELLRTELKSAVESLSEGIVDRLQYLPSKTLTASQ